MVLIRPVAVVLSAYLMVWLAADLTAQSWAISVKRSENQNTALVIRMVTEEVLLICLVSERKSKVHLQKVDLKFADQMLWDHSLEF